MESDGSYRSVKDKFWTDIFVIDLDPDEKLFYLWLFTNQHLDVCGCYQVSLKTIEYELGKPLQRVLELIQKFTDLGRIRYSEANKEIILLKWKKNNEGFFKPSNSNSIKSIRKGHNNIKTPEFKGIVSEWLGELPPPNQGATQPPTIPPNQGATPQPNQTKPNHNLITTTTTRTRAEVQLLEVFNTRMSELTQLFAHVDWEVEKAHILDYYRARDEVLDAYDLVFRWAKRIKKPEGGGNGNGHSSGTAKAGRKTGIIEANGASTDFLS